MRAAILSATLTVLLLAADSSLAGVRAFKVTTDRTIDPTSLESIVQQVIAQSGARNNDERAIAIYEYLHNTIFHWAYPTEAAPQSVGPLKVLNVYGWGLCGGQHTVLKALYETAGWECRYVGWSNPGHTTIEVNYDGRWHYFDVFLKCYFWSKDRSHVVGQEEIAQDPTLVLGAVKEGRAARQHLCCGDAAEDVIRGIKSRKVVGNSKGWASVTWRDENYSPLLRLPSGASLRLAWGSESNGFAVSGKPPQHSCGLKDLRSDSVLGPVAEHYGPRNWSNGQLRYAPDFSRPGDVADVELTRARAEAGQLKANDGTGQAVFRLPLPYAYVHARVSAAFDAGEGRLSLSTDGGKTWKPCVSGGDTSLVKQKYDLWAKAEFTGALTRFEVEALVEHNRGALPHLLNGNNHITVFADQNALAPGTMLSISYAYQEATVPASTKRTRWEGTGINYGETKTFTKEVASLPCTFAIEVGGDTPPKMLYLERAVRAK